MKFELTGVIPPLLTAFKENGDYDPAAQKEIVSFLVDRVQGFYICGTYGSGPLMTSEERKQVTEDIIRQVAGKIPVIVHVGGCSTRSVVDLAKHAQSAGAPAVAAVPPTYYGFNDDAVERHFAELVKAVTIPVFVYNNPKTTGVSVTPSLLKRLVDVGVQGLKDSSFDTITFWRLMWAVNKPGFIPVIGTEALILPSVGMGAHAAVCGLANAIPEPVLELFNACKSADLKKAGELQDKVARMRDVMHYAPTLPMIQAILRERGVNAGYARLPFVLPDKSTVEKAKAAFKALGVKL
ncbi:MAG: dihydrodipicolinate synthase family protein [Candidatus Bipolaricaulota bacterium]